MKNMKIQSVFAARYLIAWAYQRFLLEFEFDTTKSKKEFGDYLFLCHWEMGKNAIEISMVPKSLFN